MSPSIVRPAQRHRHSEPMPAPRRSAAPRGRHSGLVVGAVIACLLSGCSAGSTPTAVNAPPTAVGSPTASRSSTPARAVPDRQALLLAQYRAFWSSLAAVSRMPATKRRKVLSAVVIDPALRSALANMAELEARGQVLYGRNQPRPTAKISPDGITAVVNDCQDSTHAGVATQRTLAPVTVGVARNHVVVTMKKVDGSAWKIAFISYTKTPC